MSVPYRWLCSLDSCQRPKFSDSLVMIGLLANMTFADACAQQRRILNALMDCNQTSWFGREHDRAVLNCSRDGEPSATYPCQYGTCTCFSNWICRVIAGSCCSSWLAWNVWIAVIRCVVHVVPYPWIDGWRRLFLSCISFFQYYPMHSH